MTNIEHFGLIFISTALINNIILTQFLGLCPFMGVSKQPESVVGMCLATTCVMVIASIGTYWLYQYILVPFHLIFLQTLGFIFIIAGLVQLLELSLRVASPVLYRSLGLFLPLITSNCAVLGVVLLNVHHNQNSVVMAGWYGFSTAIGFSLVLLIFTALRERLLAADVPKPFKGGAIGMITAGIMSIAFMGFTGLLKIV